MSLFYSFLISVLVLNYVYCDSDEYLTESSEQCKQARDIYSCAKYNVLNYLDKVGQGSVIEANTTLSSVQLVKIEDPDSTETMFPGTTRAMSGDGEFTKLFKFLQRRTDRFLRSQGVAIPLPAGMRIIEEGSTGVESRGISGGKNKKGVVSILTLFGVFKIKVLVGILLVGMFFIKKVILIGALILPSIIHNLKMTCKHAIPVVHSGHHGEEHFHEEPYYGNNYGNSNSGAYSKEYERRLHKVQATHAQVTRDGQSTEQKYPDPNPNTMSTGFKQVQENSPDLKMYNVFVSRRPIPTQSQ